MNKIFENKTIYLTRGDSAMFTFELNAGSNLFPDIQTLQDGDKVYFGLMEPNQMFENSILKKRFLNTDCENKHEVSIKIDPKDTARLLPGRYYYQIKLEKNSGDVITIVDKKQFFILE